MQRFKSARHTQRFLSSHSQTYNLFQLRRHHLTAPTTEPPVIVPFRLGAMSPASLGCLIDRCGWSVGTRRALHPPT